MSFTCIFYSSMPCRYPRLPDDNTTGRHSLILLNAIGSPLEERLIPAGISPIKMAMSGAHVVVSGAAAAYVWQYKNQVKRARSTSERGVCGPVRVNLRGYGSQCFPILCNTLALFQHVQFALRYSENLL